MKRINKTKAFTLAEVMLAIGIMGIGMVFAACLFPAAIKEGEKSSNAIEGAIIADNALAVARMRISESMIYPNLATDNDRDISKIYSTLNNATNVKGNFLLISKSTENPTTSEPFLGNDLIYPIDKTPIGASNNEQPPFIETVILIENREDTRNDYMVLAASCRKMELANTIEVAKVDIDTYTKGEEYITLSSASDANKFFKDGLVIYTSGNNSTVLANVTGVDGTKVSLNHMLQENVTTNGTANDYVVVIYEASSGTPTGSNPVMSISVSRCPLME